ncbi:metallophosphoesterase [Candidatus Halobonum tyrrellensis]|uniref:Metallophosphoesterase n=1 Tax=Candidatus Halobonum tyrrellensis G22 TaxID=1324957 RepID=V4HE83_9EURY|nr:metallophosphoesterase [Candidatus Halobonum tyrrellensis]ESP88990.1 metallophosphoesterase [Candidatus Halobonum tyrrellensis G22]
MADADGDAQPLVEPVPGAPAATADLGGETGLLIADYHAGIEAGLRYERGVELDSAADERRERLLSLLARTGADRLVVLGDLGHRIGSTGDAERAELAALLDAVGVPVTLALGNHDPGVAEAFGDRLRVTDAAGARLGDVGIVHGHTWPAPDVLAADVVCTGHEHPRVKLSDEVGGGRAEKAWLRGPLAYGPFADRNADLPDWGEEPPELVVFPAFNDRSGGTWVNVEGQFLAPYLPDGLASGEAYLLDGTRLGDYRRV